MSGKTDPSAEKPAEKAGKSPKKLIVALLLLVVIAGSGLVAGKVFMGGKGKAEKARQAAAEAEEVGATLALDEFLVNLADEGHYMKASVSLGLKKGVTEERLKEKLAPIRDAVVSVLSSSRIQPLGTQQGKEDLKKALLARIDKVVPDHEVLAIYFTAFTTQ